MKILIDLMQKEILKNETCDDTINYICWIDADAIIIKKDLSLSELLFSSAVCYYIISLFYEIIF